MRIHIHTLFLAIALTTIGQSGCSNTQPSSDKGRVVVYSSVDEVFAEPIGKQFEQETGIKVELVPDTEETKSTGLLNRLIAEKERPRADVFWSGDPVRAAILNSKGVSAAYNSPAAKGLPAEFSDSEHHWTCFSARAPDSTSGTSTQVNPLPPIVSSSSREPNRFAPCKSSRTAKRTGFPKNFRPSIAAG